MNNASIHIHPRRVWRNRPPRLDAIRCFNPHTHAGCDSSRFGHIHCFIVSIHTPTQGVTQIFKPRNGSFYSFNPHTHAGCDSAASLQVPVLFIVSIHTPTQGVTIGNPNGTLMEYMFQSTHPRRVWLWSIWVFNYIVSFNPHTHAGCVSVQQREQPILQGFNPHTHAGCDTSKGFQIRLSIVSIHTPTQDVTFCCEFITDEVNRFNPHTHAGCDTEAYTAIWERWVSIHTPTQGVTYSTGHQIFRQKFQSTHPRRVWPSLRFVCRIIMEFQSTHPRRVWLRKRGDCRN